MHEVGHSRELSARKRERELVFKEKWERKMVAGKVGTWAAPDISTNV